MKQELMPLQAEVHTKDGIIKCDPVFLTPETSKPRNTFNGHDARCIVCLEPCYSLWIESESPPPGCMAGHTKASDCVEHAIPKALFRGQMVELRKRGMIK